MLRILGQLQHLLVHPAYSHTPAFNFGFLCHQTVGPVQKILSIRWHVTRNVSVPNFECFSHWIGH